MRTIGLLGGMSWESTAEYYSTINRRIQKERGGVHSAPILMLSYDFSEIEGLQARDAWDEASVLLADGAQRLETAGAEAVVICTNTMHLCAPAIESALSIPLIHIADATAQKVIAEDVATVGLLGTRFTMEQEFYAGRLASHHGLSVVTPPEADRTVVHDIIYQDLVKGIIRPEARREYQRIIRDLETSGADGIIYGCTEIELLVDATDASVPVFPTAAIHAEAAARFVLS